MKDVQFRQRFGCNYETEFNFLLFLFLCFLSILKFGQFLFCGPWVSKACLFFHGFRARKQPVENSPSVEYYCFTVRIAYAASVEHILSPGGYVGFSHVQTNLLEIIQTLVILVLKGTPLLQCKQKQPWTRACIAFQGIGSLVNGMRLARVSA